MKLADLDPADVAQQAVRALVTHLGGLSFAFGPRAAPWPLPRPEQYAETDLGVAVHTLTVYAQTGLPTYEQSRHSIAGANLLSVLAALYGSALGDLGATAVDVVDELDPEHPVDLVLVAAAARVRLSQGGRLTPRELGALSGLSARRVRQLISAGELAADEGKPARVAPEDASRWLAARGVAGV